MDFQFEMGWPVGREARRLIGPLALVLLASFVLPASAYHCAGSPCPKLFPGTHPSADQGWKYACDWPDGVHPRCHGVRDYLCSCNPVSRDFREQQNYRNARSLVDALQKCRRQNGGSRLVPDTANTDVLSWVGIECTLPSGQQWFESYPTTDICYAAVVRAGRKPPISRGPNQLVPASATWCRSD